MAVGCCVGLVDESIKVLLPTREFDFVDLVKDWVGIGLAAFAVKAIGWIITKTKRTE